MEKISAELEKKIIELVKQGRQVVQKGWTKHIVDRH